LLVEIGQRARHVVELGATFGQQHRLSGIEKYFRLEHKRSPTMRMSGRLPRMARRRPKNSER